MKFTLPQIKQVADAAKIEKNLLLRVKDIAFYILKDSFGDSLAAYRAAINPTAETSDVESYEQGPLALFIEQWAKEHNMQPAVGENTPASLEEIADDLTFESNKAALIKMLSDIESLEASGEIEHKDAIKMAADIRVKLNDKFAVQDDNKSQIVVVPPKYNKICPHTRRECYEMTEEYACAQFHLIKDPNYVG